MNPTDTAALGFAAGFAAALLLSFLYMNRVIADLRAQTQKNCDNAYAEGLKRGRSLESSTRQIRL